MISAITNVRIFDGDGVLDAATVVLDGARIAAVGGGVSDGAEVVDGRGGTLLPGLIDAHTHTSEQALALALRFGVTTELEMQGTCTRQKRAHLAENDTMADVRSSGFGLTPPGGHPSELFPAGARPGDDGDPVDDAPGADDPVMPFVTTPDEAVAAIPELVRSGSDYIKFMVDDGSVEGHPGLPMLDQATLDAGVAEAHRRGMLTIAHTLTVDATRMAVQAGIDGLAHRHGMLTIAHTLTVDATRMAVQAGIDGLAHLFMDAPHTDEIIDMIAGSGVFVVPCVVLDASMMGITGAAFADDPRVGSRLDQVWLATLRSSFDRFPDGRLDDVLASVSALRDAGVDIITGSDASVPVPSLGGLAHGASVHHELQYLVRAGLTPVQALRSATTTPARRFGLADRGRIAEGLRADLLLVGGDPTTTISDTLNLQSVWRRGHRMTLQ